ncbi:MAG: hypothetical protein HUJ94_07070 [Bacteroidales bacterium]|nr:hypothetical protein [Bacteroidales bacterium]
MNCRYLYLVAALTMIIGCAKPDDGSDSGDDSKVDPAPVEKPGTFHTDESLTIDLGMPVKFGSSGHISIFKSDGTKVDDINLADLAGVTIREDGVMIPNNQITDASKMTTFMDALGSKSSYRRIVHYTPLRIDGNNLIVKPHSSVLEFDTEYYVTIDAGALEGFGGIEAGKKTFKTVSKPAAGTEISVAPSGKADFRTIQGALNYAMGSSSAMTIKVASGTYEEMLYLRDCKDLTIKGFNSSASRISYPNNEGWMNGSGSGTSSVPSINGTIGKNGGRSIFLVENCDNLKLENITIENTYGNEKGQAECIYFNSGSNKHRLNVENCAFVSLQDTFLCKGICYVHNSLIAGHCDYIWGYPDVCLFEDCEIRTRAKGYIVQARVPSKSSKGFIFLNCRLTAESGLADESVWLARSGGSSDYYDNVLFVGCKMCGAIRKAGWCTDGGKAPNPSVATAASGWREYNSVDSKGTAITSGRASCGLILNASQAAPYLSKDLILN